MRRIAVFLSLVILSMVFPETGRAQADYKRYFDEDNLPKVREFFERGRYDIVVQVCEFAKRRGQPSGEWRVLFFESLAGMGQYEEAYMEAKEVAADYRTDLGVLLRLYSFFRAHGYREDADAVLVDVNAAARAVPKNERSALDLVRLGQAALMLGADPSKVLEQYYGPAKTMEGKRGAKAGELSPALREAYLASGRLALEKEDLKRASEEFGAILGLVPNDVEAMYGMVQALLPSDGEAADQLLRRLVEEGAAHPGAHLLQAEIAINFEKYAEAGSYLDVVESVNPRNPKAHAYRAVLAELDNNDGKEFARQREAALSVWQNNPEIDCLIGRVLSRKYRYEEGAAAQRRALAMDADYAPAKLQLAMDLLRLGDVDAAWPLAREVAASDPYNVLAHNLGILEKELAGFSTMEAECFVVKLPAREVPVYGAQAMDLLSEARQTLGTKYGMFSKAGERGEGQGKTRVEFYPDQQDFAIRSFGSLGGSGLLGVCFGSVITMNSPGGVAAAKSNWEGTLWHEYCHVVTLAVTKNRMPRWLSEGISVYEEKQRNPNWGQRMTPEYRRMILEENALTPIPEMSQAFFRAKDGRQMMFAYYQSMLVVEHIVTQYGQKALQGILEDLGEGRLIYEAISRHTAPMVAFDESFVVMARRLAESYGSGVDWTVPKSGDLNFDQESDLMNFLKKSPKNWAVRQALTRLLLEKGDWESAAKSADHLIAMLPDYTGDGNGYTLRAAALRGKGDREGEAKALESLAAYSTEALSAYQGLIDLYREQENWEGVLTNADRALAIQPFDEGLHYARGLAYEAKGEDDSAVKAYEIALQMGPQNLPEIRFRLARLLREKDPTRAKRYLLDCLADAPKYRDAYALLLEFDTPGEVPAQKGSME